MGGSRSGAWGDGVDGAGGDDGVVVGAGGDGVGPEDDAFEVCGGRDAGTGAYHYVGADDCAFFDYGPGGDADGGDHFAAYVRGLIDAGERAGRLCELRAAAD